jgi:hypothetical protein
MSNTSNDNFEAIAKDAVAALIATVLTLRIIGEEELSRAISDAAEDFCDRAIALGAE